jgi:hypothetical protein
MMDSAKSLILALAKTHASNKRRNFEFKTIGKTRAGTILGTILGTSEEFCARCVPSNSCNFVQETVTRIKQAKRETKLPSRI